MANNENKPTGKVTRIEMELFVDQLREMLPAQLQAYPIQAKALRAKYDALVREGFNETQALEIIKSRPLWE